MKRFSRTATGSRGFTMVEVIAVLVIIGIISAVAFSRVRSTDHDLFSQADIMKAHLRFAQLKALQDDTGSWQIAFNDSSSYTLNYSAAGAGGPYTGATINLPSESSNSHSFPSGITVSATSPVTFDPWGSPGNTDVTITLTQSGTPKIITVTANTGFVQ
ncbi:MAG: type II secretion system GspH family protein [Syntrophales bacterium LBB04]|nr:type II secretion system GspH family protein [Syntrophales bacterium LBB04]